MNEACKFGIKCRNYHHISEENENTETNELHKKRTEHCWFYLNRECNYPRTCKNHHPIMSPSTKLKEQHPPKPQGLTNLGNICFAISCIHAISKMITTEKIQNKTVSTILNKTTNLLNGQHEESTPTEIAEEM